MTNKPMLSVELRSLLNNCADYLEGSASGKVKLWQKELRALLDKPVVESQYDGMTQDQAQAVSDGVDEILHGKPAAQHQGEPVYLVRDHGSCCWEEMSGESLELCQAQPAEYEVRKLYAEQPAPVAVVMPERMYSDSLPSWAEEQKLVRGWNACLDAFDRLNGVKP